MIHKKIATRIMLALSLGVVWNAAGAVDSSENYTKIITGEESDLNLVRGDKSSDNRLLVIGGQGYGIWGAQNNAVEGDANNNLVTYNNPYSEEKKNDFRSLTGGSSWQNDANNNVVEVISGKILSEITGGEGVNHANNNRVILEKDYQGTSEIIGGKSGRQANNNEIVINSSGDIHGIIAGQIFFWKNLDVDLSEVEATSNTVTINAPITVYRGIAGGRVQDYIQNNYDAFEHPLENVSFNQVKKGNTLNINTFGVVAGNIYNFQNISFNIPKQLEDKAMLVLTEDEPTDLSNSNIRARIAGDTNITGPTKVVLLDKKKGELITDNIIMRREIDFSQGISRVTSLKMQTEDNDIVLYINGKPATDTTEPATKPDETTKPDTPTTDTNEPATKPDETAKPDKPTTDTNEPTTNSGETTKPDTPSNNTDSVFHHGDPLMEQTKSLVETAVAMASFTNKGADSVAETMASSVKAVIAKNNGNDSPFFNSTMFALKYETGSHIKTYGSTTQIGFGMQREKANGTVTLAPFMEYGVGKYSSLVDSGVRGDGDIHNFGGGMLVRYDTNTGAYYEGALRVGRISGDYRGVFTVGGPQAVSFDSDATYVTAHAGVGYVKPLSDTTTLDTYGTYFYSHTGGDTVRLSTGETYDFDAVDSHRLRVGTRYTKDFSNHHAVYAGLGVEHEFDGEAIAYYDGASTPSPRLKGTSGLIELGWSHNVGKARSTYQQIGVTGWFGRERGITAHANFGWVF
ncbi:autotransporter outer membrane beta-barrel domain-containing protein [uncultured Veillonella sp.]|uniref:autotransporter outer membrane beta-barrel domain-containing protein n=1 Tax=uncultured Veillonella sp. TaxID=159268 RepID=UPI002583DB80|nr:autotransporter outer membrane beta-barrel domain-containing protein [uncultured Veillonella sp.]